MKNQKHAVTGAANLPVRKTSYQRVARSAKEAHPDLVHWVEPDKSNRCCLARQLLAHRLSIRATQQALAFFLGISLRYYQELETHRKFPDETVLFRILSLDGGKVGLAVVGLLRCRAGQPESSRRVHLRG
jgi:hypothetical protein